MRRGIVCYYRPASRSTPFHEIKSRQLATLEHPVGRKSTADKGEPSFIVLSVAPPLVRSFCVWGQNICKQSDALCAS